MGRVLGPLQNRLQVKVWFKFRTRAEVRKSRKKSARWERKRSGLGDHTWLRVPQTATELLCGSSTNPGISQ